MKQLFEINCIGIEDTEMTKVVQDRFYVCTDDLSKTLGKVKKTFDSEKKPFGHPRIESVRLIATKGPYPGLPRLILDDD